ncbi:flavin reductase like domain-containing protein [Infundibulicybe gibba]|nr:flavin reductase like domain-containing protein [Infundibulicybe gibba]
MPNLVRRGRPNQKGSRNIAEMDLICYSKGNYEHSKNICQQLRILFRETAQPVAVVTSRLPSRDKNQPGQFHGATLSSFTSIAMDPYPLVTFSLRIPSRMAMSLKCPAPGSSSPMVVNLLSAQQESIARKFSRPDLHPEPFSNTSYSLSKEGLPVIAGSLGAISCQLVAAPLSLHDLEFLGGDGSNGCPAPAEGAITSELFIARVLRVESMVGDSEEALSEKLPLLYHRRTFTTVDKSSCK